jgi:hypothetical protein
LTVEFSVTNSSGTKAILMSTRHARLRAEKPPELRKQRIDTTALVGRPEVTGLEAFTRDWPSAMNQVSLASPCEA